VLFYSFCDDFVGNKNITKRMLKTFSCFDKKKLTTKKEIIPREKPERET